VVTAAIAPIATHGSGQSSSGLNSGVPSGVYGYFEVRSDGYTTWSEIATESNPASSHARARRHQSSGSAPIIPWQNFMSRLPSWFRPRRDGSERPVAQLVLQDLAARVEREGVDDLDMPRGLEVGHAPARPGDDLVGVRLRGRAGTTKA
jgi:hypothetical protein